ncbi:unnamed protein product [Cyprideis torosa]|nr:unnamed protein product [Cyprideis torosa]CAG0898054.1 unnamed protein product [Cyprideis torosa]
MGELSLKEDQRSDVGDASSDSSTNPGIAKRIRTLKKKLRDIAALEARKNAGEQLDPDQMKKIERRQELEDELEDAESSLTFFRPDKNNVMTASSGRMVSSALLFLSNPGTFQQAKTALANLQTSLVYCQPTSTALLTSVPTLYSLVDALWCRSLDVRILLGPIKTGKPLESLSGQPVRWILTESTPTEKSDDVVKAEAKLTLGFLSKDEPCEVVRIPRGSGPSSSPHPYLQPELPARFPHVVMGGTFDRLHNGHKVLLSEALVRTGNKLTIGITDGPMLVKKTLFPLIEPVDDRIAKLVEFLNDVDPTVKPNVVPITDPVGPSGEDPSMELIVVSSETERGADVVNASRASMGLPALQVYIVTMIPDKNRAANSPEEEKVSSSTGRIRLLGTLLKPPNPGVVERPYVIGLTGSMGSGKSSVSRRLQGLGAAIVDCDRLAHAAYSPGTECLQAVVREFGSEILDSDGSINRRILGGIVFSDPDGLSRLTDIVWPEVTRLAKAQIEKSESDVVVLDAAVLLEAEWDKLCHEVWVTMLPEEQCIARIMERDNITETEAKDRLDAQLTDQERMEKAHVALCTQWEEAFTQQQCEKAWTLLQERIRKSPGSQAATAPQTPHLI